MPEQTSKLEAVRLAKVELGEASAEEIAVFVGRQFGIKMKPAIVSVLLASLAEREYLEQIRRKAQVEIKQLRSEKGVGEKLGKKEARSQ
jgi:hypothetical protein